LKVEHPTLTWTEITYRAGYFDQTHLVKDFKSLAGETPSQFFRMLTAFPDVLVPITVDAPS
jgi:AraC-like DNA-binding protein